MLYGTPALPPIVDAAWVQANRDRLLLADVRWFLDGADGRAAYRRGHIPGAIFVDLDRDLAGEPSAADGRHPLPTPEDFAASMSRVGIGDGHTVVVYDQGHGGYAARLVWMLRTTGRDAALLDGGLSAWDGPLETGDAVRPPAKFSPRTWPSEWLATPDEVAAAMAEPRTRLVDARAAERYRGEVEPVDARPGHVPTALSLPFGDNVDADGRLLADDVLAARADALGLSQADDVIVYCGSGVTACHDLLVLERLGINGRLFPGSWSQWAADLDRPAALGPDPGDPPPAPARG